MGGSEPTLILSMAAHIFGLNNKGFDGNGNYTLGVKEQIIFPEISIDKINKVTGMNITIVIDSNTDKESFELLKAFGMPFISAN